MLKKCWNGPTSQLLDLEMRKKSRFCVVKFLCFAWQQWELPASYAPSICRSLALGTWMPRVWASIVAQRRQPGMWGAPLWTWCIHWVYPVRQSQRLWHATKKVHSWHSIYLCKLNHADVICSTHEIAASQPRTHFSYPQKMCLKYKFQPYTWPLNSIFFLLQISTKRVWFGSVWSLTR